jgi:enterochelin esterase-like enzyme
MMRPLILIVAILLPTAGALAESPSTRSTAAAMAAPPGDDYPVGPDSQRQKDVPQGKTFSFVFDQSKVFPGTTRTVTVYIPAQYTGEKPACLYVGLDGLGFGVPVVFDNLIHKKEMPVTIAVGVSPGQVPGAIDPKQNPRFNRSNEFDSMNGQLAKLLLDEILPEVEKRKTPDGLEIKISKDPNDRATGGGSTGAIGAFTLAWQRPDSFRRVFSAIGTYVGMRGGDQYPVLVRKTEPKPIRIFMQDGAQDEWMGGPEVGDWWMSNQMMLRALEFSGYQVEHVWGTGPHSGKQAAQVFPDAMRFLWKDWPQPVKAGESQNTFLKAILQPGEAWKEVDLGQQRANALAADSNGELWITANAVYSLPEAKGMPKPESAELTARAPMSLAIGPGDERHYSRLGESAIHVLKDGQDVTRELTPKSGQTLFVLSMTVTSDGNTYCIQRGTDENKLWLLRKDGTKEVLDSALKDSACLALSPDGQWLAVFDYEGHGGYSYRVKPDKTADAKQYFYWLHSPDDATSSGAFGACFDRDGRLYVATKMGVQVLDRNGRSRAILPLPAGERAISVCFGGKDFDTLYVSTGNKLYKRTMKSKGLPPAAAPVKLPPWGAG